MSESLTTTDGAQANKQKSPFKKRHELWDMLKNKQENNKFRIIRHQ
jgi:hypothetical protein